MSQGFFSDKRRNFWFEFSVCALCVGGGVLPLPLSLLPSLSLLCVCLSACAQHLSQSLERPTRTPRRFLAALDSGFGNLGGGVVAGEFHLVRADAGKAALTDLNGVEDGGHVHLAIIPRHIDLGAVGQGGGRMRGAGRRAGGLSRSGLALRPLLLLGGGRISAVWSKVLDALDVRDLSCSGSSSEDRRRRYDARSKGVGGRL